MSLQARFAATVGEFDLEVELEAAAGSTVAILGPNGAGKSTLLRCLAGLTPIRSGSIVLDGVTLEDTSTGVRLPPPERSIGMVFQQHLLFPSMSNLENVAFGLRSRKVPKAEARATARELLGIVGLADRGDDRPHQLSGGQSQRVALARALAIDPKLILLDEPLAALDVTTRAEIRREVWTHLAQRTECVRLLITHDPVDAFALADRVIVLEDGRVTQSGALADVAARPRTRYLADLMGVNLYECVAGGGGIVLADGLRWSSPAVGGGAGRALAAVRRRDVSLAAGSVAEPVPTAAPTGVTAGPNTVVGTVRSIDLERDRAVVIVSGAIEIAAEVDSVTAIRLGLRPGDAVTAIVEPAAIDVYPI